MSASHARRNININRECFMINIETIGLSIGSFNVLHFQSETGATIEDRDYKREKVERIAHIIRDENIAIMCLQECMKKPNMPCAADRIVCFLNGGMPHGQYECIHCADLYDQLKDYGYKFRSQHESVGEYAFIWDKSRVTFAKNRGAAIVYNAINDRITRGLDSVIAAGATAIIAGNFLLRRQGDQQNKESKQHRNGQYDGAEKWSMPMWTGIVASEAIAGNHMIADKRKESIIAMLKAVLRPPLVGLFNLNNDMNKQLRIINVHTQWAKIAGESVSGVVARRIELQYLLDVVFPVVDTQRSGFFDTTFTVMAGDFNMRFHKIDAMKDLLSGSRGLNVLQTKSSKPQLTNPIEVKERKAYPNYEPNPGKDYDHFVVNRSCWSESGTRVVTDNDSFFIYEGFARRTISDHYPIKLTTSML